MQFRKKILISLRVYKVTYLTTEAHRQLCGNIYALAAHTTSTYAWVSLYLGLPEGMSLEKARAIVAGW